MAKIGLIQSADDLGRYPYADVLSFVQSCCRGDRGESPLLVQLRPVGVEAITEEGLVQLFQALDPITWRALVFTTNALNSDSIWSAVQQHGETLMRYVDQGGGMVFLQGNYRTLPQLSERLGFAAGHRGDMDRRARALPTNRGMDDVLMAYPDPLDFDELAENADGLMSVPGQPAWGRLHWEVIELEPGSSMVPIIRSDSGDLLVARAGDGAGIRIASCKLLADWHRQRRLIRNLLSYAIAGTPTTLVFGNGSEAVAQSLAVDQHVVRANEAMNAHSWLGRHARVLLTGPKVLAEIDARKSISPLVESVVARGGSVLAADPDPQLLACHVHAIVGNQESRLITERLLDRLGAYPDWGEKGFTEASLYRLRNVLSALTYLRKSYGETIVPTLSPEKEARLLERLRGSLAPRGEPLVTRMAAMESLALLGHPSLGRELLAGAGATAHDEGPDVLLLWWSLFTEHRPEGRELQTAISNAVVEATRAKNLSSIGRICEAIAIMARGPNPPQWPDNTLRVHLTSALGEAPSRIGWLSTETTASIVRGLVAAGPDGYITPDYARLLSQAAAAMRSELHSAAVPPYAVGWYSRVTEALVAVDAALPSTIAIAPASSSGSRSDDMLPGLRVANARLQDEKETATRELAAAREAERIALPVGWTVLAVFLLFLFALPFLLVFLLTDVPLDVRITVASILSPFYYAILVRLIRHYPMLPRWLVRRLPKRKSQG